MARWPGTPRALYGLAIAAVFQGQADHAKELFTSLVRPAEGGAPGNAVSDPIILAWSHVYLGRMSDLAGNREEALGEYRAALAVQGAPEAARLAAQRGVDKPYQRPGQPGDHRDEQTVRNPAGLSTRLILTPPLTGNGKDTSS